MKRLLALVLLSTLSIVTSAQSLPTGLKVLGCTNGGSTFTIVAPSSSVSMNVSPNSSGSGATCGLPASFPSTDFVKTTADGGKTWQWTYKLSDLFPVATPPPPPVVVTVKGTLTWTPPTTNDDGTPLTDLTSYNVYEDSASIGSVPAGTTSFSLGNLTVGETHTFAVTVVNSEGTSSVPAATTYTVVKPKVPSSATGLTVTVK